MNGSNMVQHVANVKLRAFGHWFLVTDHWWLAAGLWILAAGRWLTF
jgi:hypothetical protein